MKKLLASLLALAMTLSPLSASALELADAIHLLQRYYVDELPKAVLTQPSLEAVLEVLNDPYTTYFTAEEYTDFLSSVNGESLVGIGTALHNAFDQGFPILSVLPGSSALEAGLEPGDRIIAVEGIPLTASSNVAGLITGAAGTTVTITVVRQKTGETLDYTLERRPVTIPIVTYQQEGTAGVINCTRFGESTINEVENALLQMEEDVSVWVMDLRSNPGGTAEAATGAAGLFLGAATMCYFRDANDNYQYYYTTQACPDLTDKPLIILTSDYSASGSELFSAAARDHGFGIAIGQRTYGKGIAQSVFEEANTEGMFDGDALKITTHRFYSPNGASNHIIGLLPTLLISEENVPAVTLLLTTPRPDRARGFLRLTVAGQTFYLDPEQAQGEAYAPAFVELLEALPPSAVLEKGSGSAVWTEIAPAQLADELGLTLNLRTFSDIGDSPFQREIETLAAYQLLSGYGDGSFQPENTVTRAEFCAMVATALNLPANEKALTFSDTPADAWYASPVSAMAARGFIAGYEDGTFRPHATITYEEMVTILAAAAAWANMDCYDQSQDLLLEEKLGDYQAYSTWARPAAYILDQLEALPETSAPGENGTRASAAGMLCRMMEGASLLWN